MSSATDLKSYATSTHDFYELLSLPPTFSQRDLDRAWRRTALKYHPDKVDASDTAAAEKFHLAQIGYDILSDSSIRTLYDNARTAREQKERARRMFAGERQRMREELEGREGKASAGLGNVGYGNKRAREEDQLEMEVRRLAEDGKRRRREREEHLRNEIRAEEEAIAAARAAAQAPFSATLSASSKQVPVSVAEIDRSVKIRWIPLPNGPAIDKDNLTSMFTRFGRIESAFILKIKTQRVGPNREKKQVGTGVVVFASVVGAHAAIEDIKKQTDGPWQCIESVGWAANKEPDFLADMKTSGPPATPTTPVRNRAHDFLKGNSNTPDGGEGLRKVPSFASFSGTFSTPGGSPASNMGSPSLEEITMIRLREAEKRRLAAEIRKADEEAATSA
ncbi:hypothetical protein MMC19_005943 [Ptychographa xylographoides]|nr:hypothetical protein [Ptychographa xylographoides]